MTRAEAQQVAKPLELATLGGDPREMRDVLAETVTQLRTGFGEQADTAFQQVLKEAHLGRQNAEMAAVLLRKLAAREVPTQAEARAVDEAAKTAAADRAAAPLAPLNFDPTLGSTGTDYLDPSPPVTKPAFPTPDSGAIAMLRKEPKLAAPFDRTYGPGAAQRVLAITGGR